MGGAGARDRFEGEAEPEAAVVDLEGAGELEQLSLEKGGEDQTVDACGEEEFQTGAKIALPLEGGIDEIVGLEVAEAEKEGVVEGTPEMFACEEIGLEAGAEEVLSGEDIAGEEWTESDGEVVKAGGADGEGKEEAEEGPAGNGEGMVSNSEFYFTTPAERAERVG